MIPRSRVIELTAPALEVLWSMHLNVQGHPECPLKPAAETAINGLLKLLQETRKEAAHVEAS